MAGAREALAPKTKTQYHRCDEHMESNKMTLNIGINDSFERIYMAKFRGLAAKYGEFVEYERDRAARDIGLHFVSEHSSGNEVVTPALVWFQMKGVQKAGLSKEGFENADDLSISLNVNHLQFWYIAPEPTYLVLYLESIDQFFISNMKKYIKDLCGDKILEKKQKTLTVKVSKDSVLDEQAFRLILRNRSLEAWKDRIRDGEKYGDIFLRDSDTIARIAAAQERGSTVAFVLKKYGSKMRSEAYFEEVPAEGEGEEFHGHWEFSMPDDLKVSFPYLSFEPHNNEFDRDNILFDEDEWDHEWPPLELPNGKEVMPDGVFEIVEYKMLVALNDLGSAWLQTLQVMERAGFIEIDASGRTMVSVAPWHARDV